MLRRENKMTDQQQIAVGDGEEEELEKPDEEFKEELGSDMVDIEDQAESKKKKTAEYNQQILIALGFKRYEDAGVIKYNIRVMGDKIGVTFNETNPLGKVWAYKIPEGDEDKEFLKNGDLKQHPLIQKYHAIQESKEPMPEISVAGKITEKRGKAIKVEIEENGEKKEIFYGQGAVKKDNTGYFLPSGFSKATKDHEAKMETPRDIRLPDYLTQLEQAPATDITKEKDVPKEKGEIQPTDKSTMAEVIKQEPTEYTELITKYTNMLAEVTEAVLADDRIPSREKGYAVKFIYYSVKYASEGNGKGGDQEEQA